LPQIAGGKGDFFFGGERMRKRNSVTQEEAINKLMAAGINWAALLLQKFKNVDGNKGGWDGYAQARFNRNILDIIWPPGEEQCKHCKEYFSKFQCSAHSHLQCDCPRCQGYCKCKS